MTAAEKALSLCQQFGKTTLFEECTNGSTLPLEVAKKCALIAVDEVIKILKTLEANTNYWQSVKWGIENI